MMDVDFNGTIDTVEFYVESKSIEEITAILESYVACSSPITVPLDTAVYLERLSKALKILKKRDRFCNDVTDLKCSDKYWYIDDDGDIDMSQWNPNSKYSRDRLETNNVFIKREYAEYVKHLAPAQRNVALAIRQLKPTDEAIDFPRWVRTHQDKYCFSLMHGQEVAVGKTTRKYLPNEMYMSSYDQFEKVRKLIGDDVIKAMF